MKIIKYVGPSCPCHEKLTLFEAQRQARGERLHIGSIVECDCGVPYKLLENQRDGLYWTKIAPDAWSAVNA